MKNKIKRMLCLLIPVIVLGTEIGLAIWSYATTGGLLPEIMGYSYGITAGLLGGFVLAEANRPEKEDK